MQTALFSRDTSPAPLRSQHRHATRPGRGWRPSFWLVFLMAITWPQAGNAQPECDLSADLDEGAFTRCFGREAFIVVPDACRGTGCPLLLFLPGAEHNAVTELENSDLDRWAREFGFILVLPTGSGLGGVPCQSTSADIAERDATCVNFPCAPGYPLCDSPATSVDRYGFMVEPDGPAANTYPGAYWIHSGRLAAWPPEYPDLIQMVNHLTGVFGANPAGIHVGGFSNGGRESWLLLCQYPDSFASMITVSGRADTRDGSCPFEPPSEFARCDFSDADSTPERQIPILAIQGERDPFIPIECLEATVGKVRDAWGLELDPRPATEPMNTLCSDHLAPSEEDAAHRGALVGECEEECCTTRWSNGTTDLEYVTHRWAVKATEAYAGFTCMQYARAGGAPCAGRFGWRAGGHCIPQTDPPSDTVGCPGSAWDFGEVVGNWIRDHTPAVE